MTGKPVIRLGACDCVVNLGDRFCQPRKGWDWGEMGAICMAMSGLGFTG